MKELRRILIGHDGSQASNAAIRDLKGAGLPERMSATILTAVDTLIPPAAKAFGISGLSLKQLREVSAISIKRGRNSAETAAQALKAIFPRWTIRTEVREASPTQALIEKARSWNADLIAVGAHGHSHLGRFMGSVSQLVLTQAPCSVRVGRRRINKGRDAKILVAVDGSAGSERALEAVAGRTWPTNSQIAVISVLRPYEIALRNEKRYQVREAAGRVLEHFADRFREKLPKVSFRIAIGDPKFLISQEAAAWGADCIFVGARSLSSARRLWLGGVSMAIAARASCSVEVVR